MSAYLVGVDLRGANLSGADVRYANLSGADLRGATLDYRQLNTSIMNATTKLPDGFAPGVSARFLLRSRARFLPATQIRTHGVMASCVLRRDRKGSQRFAGWLRELKPRAGGPLLRARAFGAGTHSGSGVMGIRPGGVAAGRAAGSADTTFLRRSISEPHHRPKPTSATTVPTMLTPFHPWRLYTTLVDECIFEWPGVRCYRTGPGWNNLPQPCAKPGFSW